MRRTPDMSRCALQLAVKGMTVFSLAQKGKVPIEGSHGLSEAPKRGWATLRSRRRPVLLFQRRPGPFHCRKSRRLMQFSPKRTAPNGATNTGGALLRISKLKVENYEECNAPHRI